MKIGVYLQMLIVEESDQPDSGPIRVCLGVESIQAKTIQQLPIVGDIFYPSKGGVRSMSVFN